MYEIIDKEIFNKSFNYLKNNRHIAFVVVDNEVGLCIKDIVIRLQSYLLCYFKSITIIMSGSVNQCRNIDTKCTYVETIIISEDEVDILCRLQRTFFLFSNVFFAHSTGFDDDSYDNLIMFDLKLQERFPVQVMLDKPGLPYIERIKNNQYIKCIDWNKYNKWTNQDFLECSSLSEYAKKKIQKLIDQHELAFGETICLYGSSKLTEEIINQFSKDFCFVIADMNKDKVGIRDDGIEVVDAKEMLYLNKIDEKILVTVVDYKNVCQELVNAGYDFPLQVKPIRYKKDYLDMSCEEARKDIESRLEQWKEAYEEIRIAYPMEYLFVSPHVSGDIYLSCLYLYDYSMINTITDYVYIVANKSAKKVAELFGIDAVIWDKEKLFDIVSWGRYIGFEETKIKKMHPSVGDQRGLWHYVMDIDYNTMMQKWIFKNPHRITSFEIKQESSDHIFEKYGLGKGKTVLISPYSHSVSQMDLTIFNKMVDRLKEKGFFVCTNIAGEEKALPNTVGLCVPYVNCVDFLNKAGYFIGARSGFCDVISTTKAKMVVLYRSDSYKHFSIKEMGLKTEEIFELCIDTLSEEDIVEKAIEAITNNKE